MTERAKWVKWKHRHGWVVRDTSESNRWTTEDLPDHLWVISQIEGAHRGTIQSYDGAGVSGGIIHHVLVYPRGGWGTFAELLRDCLWDENYYSSEIYRALVDDCLAQMKALDGEMAEDASFGFARYDRVLSIAEAAELFDRKESKELMLAVHRVLKHPYSYEHQIAHAQRYLEERIPPGEAVKSVLADRETYVLWASFCVRASGHARRALLDVAAGKKTMHEAFRNRYPARYRKTVDLWRKVQNG